MKPDECPECGFPTSLSRGHTCLKCEADLTDKPPQRRHGLLEIDVAHHGQTVEIAYDQIAQAVNRALMANYRGVKIVHGYGSGKGHTSHIREMALPLLKSLAQRVKGKVVADQRNPGAHILYF